MSTQTADSWTLGDAIVEHIAEAVIYADREGRIQRWNTGAVQVFGFSAADAIGQTLDLMIPAPLRAAHWRGFQAAMNGGALRLNGHATLTRGLHQSGRKLYIEMSFALVHDAADQVLGSVAVARDVTDRVEREKAARAATSPAR
ncbi:histidine kinase [Hydrogenophaga crassostreae]|uniref:Histidine kinase n=1 Tax=Hydrogenophaga crassostreae TaxID=1763535 RepID=A0A167IT47_9BURK|nr:PAS domain S-box protein [Hydrogenophaga crassostreae]AOW14425.1 hypothetical protein LPB072_17870 [Hydrogenophaga crassostreae]OAD43550.1 histidine kinase [Hydrogenophaga crassostreae]